MSYSLQPWHVDISQVAAFRGAGIAPMAAWRKNCADVFEGNDEWFATEIGDGARTLQQAVEDIPCDRIPSSGDGFQYGYALEFLCRFHGVCMPNNAFSPANAEFIASFDRALTGLRVPKPFLITTWMYRGPPIALPSADDVPMIGHLRLAEVREALGVVPPARSANVARSSLRRSVSTEIG